MIHRIVGYILARIVSAVLSIKKHDILRNSICVNEILSNLDSYILIQFTSKCFAFLLSTYFVQSSQKYLLKIGAIQTAA